jgi:choline monooxygenase
MNLEAMRDALIRINAAQGLPLTSDFYTSPDWLSLERREIFRREWICLGRSSEFPQAGDYRTYEIDHVPLMVVRRRGGELAAMSTVCAHRMALVAEGAGCAKGFVCPYHGWSYDLEGRLISAPRMPSDFSRGGRGLQQLALEEWNGFVYINLDRDARPLGKRLEPLTRLLAPYHMERMPALMRRRHVWRTNWKILVENFLEAYHVNVTHPDSLAPFAPPPGVKMLPGEPGFQFYQHRMADDFKPVPLDPRIGIPNEELSDDEKQMAYIGCVFPSHVFSVTWDAIFWLTILPIGVGEIEVDVGLAGPFKLPAGETPDPDHPNLYYLRLIEAVNEEDRLRVEAVQRGALSGFGGQGILHPHEATISGFIAYLCAQMAETVGAA